MLTQDGWNCDEVDILVKNSQLPLDLSDDATWEYYRSLISGYDMVWLLSWSFFYKSLINELYTPYVVSYETTYNSVT